MAKKKKPPIGNVLPAYLAFEDEGFDLAEIRRIFRALRRLRLYQEDWPVEASYFIETIKPQAEKLYIKAVKPNQAEEPRFIQKQAIKYLDEHKEQFPDLKREWFQGEDCLAEESNLYTLNRERQEKPDFIAKVLQAALADRGFPSLGINQLTNLMRPAK